MLKKIHYSPVMIFLLFTVLFFLFSTNCWADAPDISADAAILIDADTGEIYYNKNGEKRMSPASLTKVMTGIIAIEMGRPKDVVEVGRRAHNIYVGSTMGLALGDKLTLDDLTKAALMMSANDATVAIAEHISGEHDAFVQQMDLKAYTLGAFKTRFQNTNGYTLPNHYSTAYDLAFITRYALKNDRFAKIVRTKEDTVKWKNKKKEIICENTNRMLKDDNYYYPGINGVKTGTTARAGHCLIASATRDGRQLIAVVLHCKNRYRDAAALLDYGFNEHMPKRIVRAGEAQGTVIALNGTTDKVTVVAEKEIEAVLSEADMEHLGIFRYVIDEVEAPVHEGQILGRLIVTCRDRVVDDIDLLSKNKVLEDGLFNRLRHKIQQD